jgi:hypothetical protein
MKWCAGLLGVVLGVSAAAGQSPGLVQTQQMAIIGGPDQGQGQWHLANETLPTSTMSFIPQGVIRDISVPAGALWCRISKVEIILGLSSPFSSGSAVQVRITGVTAGAGYVCDHVDRQISGKRIALDMYWTGSGSGTQVATPYERTESLGGLEAGVYTLTVRYYENGQLADQDTTSFTVSGSNPLPTFTMPVFNPQTRGPIELVCPPQWSYPGTHVNSGELDIVNY